MHVRNRSLFAKTGRGRQRKNAIPADTTAAHWLTSHTNDIPCHTTNIIVGAMKALVYTYTVYTVYR